MAHKKVTIHDIATSLGITASTVSRALSNHPRISQTTKNKVLQLARELSYKPNQLASSLRKGKGNSIGVIVPRINRHFFSNAISGMESITNPAGYTLMICQTNEDYETEVKGLESLVHNRVDGIIMSISANTHDSVHIQQALDEGIRVVQFDRVSSNLQLCRVVNDNFTGAYELTRHLLQLGYRRIFHFSGPLHINIYQDRFAGFQKAMKEADIPITQDMIYENILTRGQGETTIISLAQENKLPEAIFAASDYSALGALAALQEKYPEKVKEVEIAGFGNEPFTELLTPGMTTVEQYGIQMGKEAAKLLIDAIETQEPALNPVEKQIRTKLIIRK